MRAQLYSACATVKGGGIVPPNKFFGGGTVPPNNFFGGGTVPPNNFFGGGNIPPNSHFLLSNLQGKNENCICLKKKKMQ